MIDRNNNRQKILELQLAKDQGFSSELQVECESLYSMFSSFNKSGSDDGQIIGITGSRPGEGATTISILSALALCTNPTNSVLLIDCNLRNPELHKYFNPQEQKDGLIELIEQGSNLTDVLWKEKKSGFHFISSGRPVDSPSEFLSTNKFINTLMQLKKKYRYIILDCAPVLNAPETSILASHLTGVILVVRSESTRYEIVASAKQRLVDANANIKGVILNKQKHYIPNFLYKRL